MIETKHLFPILDSALITLLRSLDDKDWNTQTIAKLWKVKDVAAHLLDGNIRVLAQRDGHFIPPDREINSYAELVDYLNQLNADWVKASARMSRKVMTDFLEITGKQYSDYIQTLNDDDNAIFSVSWAGEEVSKNWFHIAREFTEKWHHQQQIREAVCKQGILTKELFYPFIDTLLRGLPHTYRGVGAATGTAVLIEISSEIGGKWYLTKAIEGWQISKESATQIETEITIKPEIAWKLFTKGMAPEQALEQVSITGNQELGRVALGLVAVMA